MSIRPTTFIPPQSQNINYWRVDCGVKPTVDQLYQWLERALPIQINVEGNTLRGRIERIGNHVSREKNDAVFWIADIFGGIYLRNIKGFQALSSVNGLKEDEVVLKSGNDKFLIPYSKYQENYRYFHKLELSLFQEGDELNLSSILSSNQLKLIALLLDGKLINEIPLSPADAADLYIAASVLGLEEIKTFLINKFPVVKGIDSFLAVRGACLTLPCNQTEHKTYLGTEGIISVLKWISSKGIPIQKLNIQNTNDVDLPLLVEAISQLTTLESLTINWNNVRHVTEGLTDKSAFLLKELIEKLPLIKNLKISDERITSISLMSIADAIEHHPKIENLDLSCNNFSSEGFNYLSRKLTNLKTLTSLNIAANRIGKTLKVSDPFVKALSLNQSLRHLNVGNNIIDDSGAIGFASVIRNNPRLLTLNLWGNRIEWTGRAIIVEALEANSTLTNVEVNTVSSEQDPNFHPQTVILRGTSPKF